MGSIASGGLLAMTWYWAERPDAAAAPMPRRSPAEVTFERGRDGVTIDEASRHAAAFRDAARAGEAGARLLALPEEVCRTDPRLARQLAGEVGEQSWTLRRDAYRVVIATEIREGQFRRVTEWLDEISDPALRSETWAYLMREWGAQEPATAALWLFEEEFTPERQAWLVGMIDAWGRTSPVAAAEFSRALPPGRERQLAVGRAVGQWIGLDPVAAAAWVDALEPSADFDHALFEVATLGGLDSAIAWSLAKRLRNPEHRRAAMEEIATAWARTDPTAAARALAAERP